MDGHDGTQLEQPPSGSFPIVGIGASAGGLEALRPLLSRLPADTGMAFVVVQHLDRATPSILPTLLAGATAMPVVAITGRTAARPDHVYVMPGGADLSIEGDDLVLVERAPDGTPHHPHHPIDAFLRALAQERGERAIGVVLSGAATDGTEGLRAIKAGGGITLAQAPTTATHRGMPDSAIAAGVVDHRGAPEALADELARLSREPYLTAPAPDGLDDTANLAPVLALLREHARLDFRGYKRATLLRRIGRRMALRRAATLGAYATLLRAEPAEARALSEDVLIHVTSFFRDPGAFDALGREVVPALLATKSDDATLRVWVAGCSTGEEAYSIAILLTEGLEIARRALPIKIFASDLSDAAIEAARTGLYTQAAVLGVSPERLARFFERAEGGYRIAKPIRDCCVFVRHDLTRDPPFARLDLISCRNVLIYFDTELQRRILPLLHHCLNRPGYLLLGASEGVRELDELFTPVDKEHRLFARAGDSPRLDYPPALSGEAESRLPAIGPAPRPHPAREAQRQADHLLLARYAPPGAVINDRFDVVQFRGRTGAYLEPPPGQPQTNVLKLARGGLATPLRAAIEDARTRGGTVRSRGIRLSDGGGVRVIDLEVTPLTAVPGDADRYYLLIFEEHPAEGAAPRPAPPPLLGPPGAGTDTDADELASLRAELSTTREYLQAISSEHQDLSEELGAANEELLATNEELQSTNEELQSAQEELQSTNEELTTLNDELRLRNQHLDLIASDLVNVLESVRIPVIIVDLGLRIRRFTPSALAISNLLPGDVGRSIDDLKLRLKIDDLAERIRATLASLAPHEADVQALDGRWFHLTIRPYLTPDHRLDGAVLSFVDVDRLKQALAQTETARDYAQTIVEIVPIALVVIDAQRRIVSANPPFTRAFGVRTGATPMVSVLEVAGGALGVPVLREAIAHSLTTRAPFRELEVPTTLPGAGARSLVVAGCPLQAADGAPLLMLALEDVTAKRQLEASEHQARLDAEQANRAKDLFLATLSHELRAPLGTIMMSAQVLQMAATDDPKVRRAAASLERAIRNQSRLIEDLLDVSRIVSGKLLLDLQDLDLRGVVVDAVDAAQDLADGKGITLEAALDEAPAPMRGDPVRLQQVVGNLIQNAVKFTPTGGRIDVRLDVRGSTAVISVSDTGIGMRPEQIPLMFERFVQAEATMTRAHGGLGLGLAIVRHIVGVHGGEIHATSPGEGKGSTFTVTFPLAAPEALPVNPRPRTSVHDIAGARVLLIDDDADTRDACATVLATRGAEIRTARSAAEGLAAVGEFLPHAILCDLAMPGEDGVAFIRALRRSPVGGATPAAALTALASPEDRRRTLDAGFQLHLAKPLDVEELVGAVAALIAPPAPPPAPAPAPA